MINEEQLKKIRDFAVDLDWNRAFGGKSKGNQHLFRVVAISKKIILELNAKPSDVEITNEKTLSTIDYSIIEAGAWLHDSGLAKDIMGSALCNQSDVETFLLSIGVIVADIQKIMNCIESHDGKNAAMTIEAMIVHDSDTIDKMGPLGVIRETWKRSQIGWTTEKIAEHLPKHLLKRQNNLYTEPARNMAKDVEGSLTEFFSVLSKQIASQ